MVGFALLALFLTLYLYAKSLRQPASCEVFADGMLFAEMREKHGADCRALRISRRREEVAVRVSGRLTATFFRISRRFKDLQPTTRLPAPLSPRSCSGLMREQLVDPGSTFRSTPGNN